MPKPIRVVLLELVTYAVGERSRSISLWRCLFVITMMNYFEVLC